MALIDQGTINRYKVWEGGKPHPRGAGFIIDESSHVDEGPSEPRRTTSTSTRHSKIG